ncbi:hypothetical protein Btru_070316 [Bulinus truncatus]|nr:hypothetical protein Btru_070316 [Bulinus truncatus]
MSWSVPWFRVVHLGGPGDSVIRQTMRSRGIKVLLEGGAMSTQIVQYVDLRLTIDNGPPAYDVRPGHLAPAHCLHRRRGSRLKTASSTLSSSSITKDAVSDHRSPESVFKQCSGLSYPLR